jgi:DNA-binding CsgD family transcriptional regulator
VPTIRGLIAELLAQGVSTNQIAWRLGVAPTTVSYHIGALRREKQPEASESDCDVDVGAAVDRVRTRELVAALLAEGLSRAEIARKLGLTKPTITYHARRLHREVNESCARRYDWKVIQRYYDEGHSVQECQKKFGFSKSAWHDAARRGVVVTRPAGMPLADLLVSNRPRGRFNIKLRLVAAGLKDGDCEVCGLTEWRGKPISMSLHHVNGDRHDNRLENLRLLCPNCHSQTDTFAGRNRPERNGSPATRPPTAPPEPRTREG